MEFQYLIYKSLPVLWWIAIWGLVDLFVYTFLFDKKHILLIFYLTMIVIVLGILYLDKKAETHF
jgi:hypothetical protein